jgi:RNA polymerase I-specific transcription initiation factor RRN3
VRVTCARVSCARVSCARRCSCRSKYTQFLVFFVCQLAPSYPDAFVGRLVNICLDTTNEPMTRQCAAAYLGSFLSRAVYIKDTTL